MGVEEYANKKIKEYERVVREEALRKQNAERAKDQLAQRNQEN